MSAISGSGTGVRSKGLVLTAMIFAVAMTFIDQTIVPIAAPTIQHDPDSPATLDKSCCTALDRGSSRRSVGQGALVDVHSARTGAQRDNGGQRQRGDSRPAPAGARLWTGRRRPVIRPVGVAVVRWQVTVRVHSTTMAERRLHAGYAAAPCPSPARRPDVASQW